MKCFLCDENEAGIINFDDDTFRNCYLKILFRKQKAFKYHDVTLTKECIEYVGYHTSCYKKVTALSQKYNEQYTTFVNNYEESLAPLKIEVQVKEESIELSSCPTCLSGGRRLAAVTPELREYASAACHGSMDWDAPVCWECSAMLRKAMMFKCRAARAQQCLAWAHTQEGQIYLKHPLSTLQCTIKTEYDLEICHEDEDNKPEELQQDEVLLDIKQDSSDAWSDDANSFFDGKQEETQIKREPEEESKPIKTKLKKKKKFNIRIIENPNKRKLSTMDIFTTVPITENEMNDMRESDRCEEKYTKRPHRCDTCIMAFTNADKRAQHFKICHSQKSGRHECSVCSSRFPSLERLQRHEAHHYERYVCNACGLTMRRAQGMYRHYLFQHETASLKCEHCDIVFGTQKDLSKHRQDLHTNFVCDMCGQKFHSRRTIKKHMFSRHLPLRCEDCGMTVKSRVSLAQHRYRRHAAHSPTADSYCVECDKQFRHRLAYKDHVALVHRTAPKYACPECGKQFTRSVYLRNHRDLVHLNTINYRCEQCDKGFLRQDGLRRHLKHVHERVPMPRTKVCDICGRAFQTNRILINHRRTHTGERPFQCELCSAAFAQQTALRSHVKHIHEHCARSK